MGCSAVGRKYGVSDNAIRKWRRSYEAERGIVAALPPGARGHEPALEHGRDADSPNRIAPLTCAA